MEQPIQLSPEELSMLKKRCERVILPREESSKNEEGEAGEKQE